MGEPKIDHNDLMYAVQSVTEGVADFERRFVSYMDCAERLAGVCALVGDDDDGSDDQAIHDAMLALVNAHHETAAAKRAIASANERLSALQRAAREYMDDHPCIGDGCKAYKALLDILDKQEGK